MSKNRRPPKGVAIKKPPVKSAAVQTQVMPDSYKAAFDAAEPSVRSPNLGAPGYQSQVRILDEAPALSPQVQIFQAPAQGSNPIVKLALFSGVAFLIYKFFLKKKRF